MVWRGAWCKRCYGHSCRRICVYNQPINWKKKRKGKARGCISHVFIHRNTCCTLHWLWWICVVTDCFLAWETINFPYWRISRDVIYFLTSHFTYSRKENWKRLSSRTIIPCEIVSTFRVAFCMPVNNEINYEQALQCNPHCARPSRRSQRVVQEVFLGPFSRKFRRAFTFVYVCVCVTFSVTHARGFSNLHICLVNS